MTKRITCPICKQRLYDTKGDRAEDHLIACGCIVDIESIGDNGQFYNCACGDAFIDSGSGRTIAGDLLHHCKEIQHDWARIGVTRTLERM